MQEGGLSIFLAPQLEFGRRTRALAFEGRRLIARDYPNNVKVTQNDQHTSPHHSDSPVPSFSVAALPRLARPFLPSFGSV